MDAVPFLSALAAGGSFLTAIVIAVTNHLDRRERREQAYRANLVPYADENRDSPLTTAVVLVTHNHGPWHAREVQLRVRPPSDGVAGELPMIQDTDGPNAWVRESIIPAGGVWKVWVSWTEAWSRNRSLGVELQWAEESGRKQSLSIDLPPPTS